MSFSIQELFDYDLVKRCCKHKSICLKIKFYENRTTKDEYNSNCICCCK